MSFKSKRITTVVALLLALAIGQMYLTVSLAGPGGNASASPQQSNAILTTSRSRPISVNGANAVSGATILTGAVVETPDQVEATIDIPGHFSLEIEPNAKLMMEFDPNGIKVTLIHGCVKLHTKQGTRGEIVNEQGRSLGKSDPAKDGVIKVCERRVGGALASPAGVGGLSPATTVGIVGAAAADTALAVAILVNRGNNPSPGAPSQ